MALFPVIVMMTLGAAVYTGVWIANWICKSIEEHNGEDY